MCRYHGGSRAARSTALGDIDLLLADDEAHGLFDYGECHGHWHFSHYADFDVLDSSSHRAFACPMVRDAPGSSGYSLYVGDVLSTALSVPVSHGHGTFNL